MRKLHCNCPGGNELRAAQLAGGLPAQACDACGGAVIELDDYRRWLSQEPAADEATTAEVHDHAAARPCPHCSRLMQRLRVGADPDFRVDRCAACGLLWLDRGEWDALRAAGLARGLTQLLADAGQREIQEREHRRRREAALRDKHGDACIDELARIRQWLTLQAGREELLVLLRSGW